MTAATTPERPAQAADPILLGMYVLQRGRFAYVNQHLAAILGYDDPAALIGCPFWELVHPDDRRQVKILAASKTPGLPPGVEVFRIRQKNGRCKRVCLRGDNAPYLGKPANIGCLLDMGTLEQMRAALEKYRAMINEVDDAIAELDLEGNVRFSNTSVCRKWETLGDKTQTLNFRTYVDEGSVDQFIQGYKRVYDTGVPGRHIRYRVKLADGQRLTVEDAVSLMRDEEGTITGFRVVSRNITERLAAEKRLAWQRSQLEAIFRSVNDAIITVDPSLKVMEANLSAATICGLETGEIAGRLLSGCMQHCNRACLDVIRRAIDQQNSLHDHRIACEHAGNPRQVVSLSISPLSDPKGRYSGVVLVIRDITRQHTIEFELQQRHQYRNIIGKSPKWMEVVHMVEKLADLDTTVLITGDSGTGKAMIAKALHYSGRRAGKPFVSVNCAALNANLLESELFGHVRGAFTGAAGDKQGRFEAAGGGTLLLDEIGDIPLQVQLKLLRVIQEKTYERVGESASRRADVRIIACTNADLKEKVTNGAFREDLYYRFKVVQLHLPPLRDRAEDVPLLAEHFRAQFNKRYNKHIKRFSGDVLHRLMTYGWPGNVRELEHLIERAFVVCRGSEIQVAHLPMEMHHE